MALSPHARPPISHGYRSFGGHLLLERRTGCGGFAAESGYGGFAVENGCSPLAEAATGRSAASQKRCAAARGGDANEW